MIKTPKDLKVNTEVLCGSVPVVRVVGIGVARQKVVYAAIQKCARER